MLSVSRSLAPGLHWRAHSAPTLPAGCLTPIKPSGYGHDYNIRISMDTINNIRNVNISLSLRLSC